MSALLDHVHQFSDHLPDLLAAVPEPNPKEPPAGFTDKIKLLLSWGAWMVSVACVAGILITAGRMAVAHRRGDDTNISGLGWVLGACILAGSASGIVGALL